MSTAANQHNRPIGAGDLLHLAHEMRIDVPVGPIVPCDVMRADRMADEEILHLAAAIDEDGGRVVVKELYGLGRFQVLHGGKSSTSRVLALGPLHGRL